MLSSLPCKIHSLDRFVSLLLYNHDTGKSRSEKWVENLGFASSKLILLRAFGANPFVFLDDSHIDLTKSDKNSLFGSKVWE